MPSEAPQIQLDTLCETADRWSFPEFPAMECEGLNCADCLMKALAPLFPILGLRSCSQQSLAFSVEFKCGTRTSTILKGRIPAAFWQYSREFSMHVLLKFVQFLLRPIEIIHPIDFQQGIRLRIRDACHTAHCTRKLFKTLTWFQGDKWAKHIRLRPGMMVIFNRQNELCRVRWPEWKPEGPFVILHDFYGTVLLLKDPFDPDKLPFRALNTQVKLLCKGRIVVPLKDYNVRIPSKNSKRYQPHVVTV